MHTFYVISGGFLLLGIFVAFARALSNVRHSVRGRLLLAFIPVWLACAAFNMWIGVQAGYSLGDELPVFVLVFVVPAASAYWFWRRRTRRGE